MTHVDRAAPRERGCTLRPRVFLSYRRKDTPGQASWIYDGLVRHLGPDRVFRDFDVIQAGSSFAAAIREALAESDLVLALIGHGWLEEDPAARRTRLFDPEDWVRLELESALGSGTPILPVLINGVTMPPPGLVPEELWPVLGIEAVEVSDKNRDTDVKVLVETIASLLNDSSLCRALARLSYRLRRLLFCATVLLTLGLALLTWKELRDRSRNDVVEAIRPYGFEQLEGGLFSSKLEFRGDATGFSKGISTVAKLSGVVDLDLLRNTELQDLGKPEELPRLRSLDLSCCTNMVMLNGLAGQGRLEELLLSDVSATSFEFLGSLRSLRTLDLRGTLFGDSDFTHLALLEDLRVLKVPAVPDPAALEPLKNLSYLCVQDSDPALLESALPWVDVVVRCPLSACTG
ncbi:MAG: toll/interleukin-1 receptor domain-containing protein [bacterium]|nr:toll/interleukin-1 receptor domain-containing protein [bacterium]